MQGGTKRGAVSWKLSAVFFWWVLVMLNVFVSNMLLQNACKNHQKYVRKTDENDPKVVPKGVPKWSPNHQKWGLGRTLFQGWLPSGLQTPSRIDFGEVLEPFSTVFLIQFLWFLHAFFSSMLQTNTFKITRNHQKDAAESFQETASLFVQSCIEKFTSSRQQAFRFLLVQVETG